MNNREEQFPLRVCFALTHAEHQQQKVDCVNRNTATCSQQNAEVDEQTPVLSEPIIPLDVDSMLTANEAVSIEPRISDSDHPQAATTPLTSGWHTASGVATGWQPIGNMN